MSWGTRLAGGGCSAKGGAWHWPIQVWQPLPTTPTPSAPQMKSTSPGSGSASISSAGMRAVPSLASSAVAQQEAHKPGGSAQRVRLAATWVGAPSFTPCFLAEGRPHTRPAALQPSHVKLTARVAVVLLARLDHGGVQQHVAVVAEHGGLLGGEACGMCVAVSGRAAGTGEVTDWARHGKAAATGRHSRRGRTSGASSHLGVVDLEGSRGGLLVLNAPLGHSGACR